MKCSIAYFSRKKFWSLFFSFFFFGIFVVDFKITVKLRSMSFTFMSTSLLSSLGHNLVFLKMLIFCGDILKSVYKEILLLRTSIFSLYTLIPNSEFEVFLSKISFSLRKLQLKGSAIARSIDNCFAHYLRYLYFKYIYKN